MTTRATMALVAITHMETLYTRRPEEGVRIHFLSLAEHPGEMAPDTFFWSQSVVELGGWGEQEKGGQAFGETIREST